MEFYRAFLDAEVVCDLLVQFSLHDVVQHLSFARTECVEARTQPFQPCALGTLSGIAVERAFHCIEQILLRRASLENLPHPAASLARWSEYLHAH